MPNLKLKGRKPLTKKPQKRDPKLKPLQGFSGHQTDSKVSKSPEFDTIQKPKDTRNTTCKRCMGFGGMDGGCPKCGGSGFSD